MYTKIFRALTAIFVAIGMLFSTNIPNAKALVINGDASQLMTDVKLSSGPDTSAAWTNGTEVNAKDPFYITYNWAIDSASPGDTYTMQMPDQITTYNTIIPMLDDDGTQIAFATVLNNTVIITFSSGVEGKTNIKGFFQMGANFVNTTVIQNDGNTSIQLPVADSSKGSLDLNVTNTSSTWGPSTGTSSIVKTGQQVKDADGKYTDEVDWTITVNKVGAQMLNPIVSETFGAGQTYVPDSMYVNYRTAVLDPDDGMFDVSKIVQRDQSPNYTLDNQDTTNGGGTLNIKLADLTAKEDADGTALVSLVIHFRTKILNFDQYNVGDNIPKASNPNLTVSYSNEAGSQVINARSVSIGIKTSQISQNGGASGDTSSSESSSSSSEPSKPEDPSEGTSSSNSSSSEPSKPEDPSESTSSSSSSSSEPSKPEDPSESSSSSSSFSSEPSKPEDSSESVSSSNSSSSEPSKPEEPSESTSSSSSSSSEPSKPEEPSESTSSSSSSSSEPSKPENPSESTSSSSSSSSEPSVPVESSSSSSSSSEPSTPEESSSSSSSSSEPSVPVESSSSSSSSSELNVPVVSSSSSNSEVLNKNEIDSSLSDQSTISRPKQMKSIVSQLVTESVNDNSQKQDTNKKDHKMAKPVVDSNNQQSVLPQTGEKIGTIAAVIGIITSLSLLVITRHRKL